MATYGSRALEWENSKLYYRELESEFKEGVKAEDIHAGGFFTLIRYSPCEFHYHEVNRDNVLSWLKENAEDLPESEVSDVIAHWEGKECLSQASLMDEFMNVVLPELGITLDI
ncbi:hypothetical protein AX16_003356 [Volvariella volvacea WC 439]|nr:hypothetical protein AX16_003356 [Volvariella volvacea WC 439]